MSRIIDRIRKKCAGSGGFSFTELLAATTIMLLATGLLTSTIRVAIEQFYKSTRESEAQILCASLSTYMETELANAKVTVNSDGTCSVSSDTHGMGGNIQFGYVTASGSVDSTGDTDTTGNTGEAPSATSAVDYGFTGGSIWPQGGETPAAGSNVSMQIVESSPTHSQIFKNFNIAGAGAYVRKDGSYALTSQMNMQFSSDAFTIEIHVNDTKSGKELAANKFTVRPVEVINGGV